MHKLMEVELINAPVKVIEEKKIGSIHNGAFFTGKITNIKEPHNSFDGVFLKLYSGFAIISAAAPFDHYIAASLYSHEWNIENYKNVAGKITVDLS